MQHSIEHLQSLLPSHWKMISGEDFVFDGRNYDKPIFIRTDGLAIIYFNEIPNSNCVFSICYDFHHDGDCRLTFEEAIEAADHYVNLFPLQLKVFLDDERKTPEGWERVYDVVSAISYLETRCVTHLSIDNDLGSLDTNTEGFNLLNWLEQTVFHDPFFPIPLMRVHSDNAVRVKSMLQTIDNISKYAQQGIYYNYQAGILTRSEAVSYLAKLLASGYSLRNIFDFELVKEAEELEI